MLTCSFQCCMHYEDKHVFLYKLQTAAPFSTLFFFLFNGHLQFSTFNFQIPTFDFQPSTSNCQPEQDSSVLYIQAGYEKLIPSLSTNHFAQETRPYSESSSRKRKPNTKNQHDSGLQTLPHRTTRVVRTQPQPRPRSPPKTGARVLLTRAHRC